MKHGTSRFADHFGRPCCLCGETLVANVGKVADQEVAVYWLVCIEGDWVSPVLPISPSIFKGAAARIAKVNLRPRRPIP